MSDLTLAIAFTLCVAALLAATYGFIPRVAQALALHLLHGLRERLYGMGKEPAFKQTLVYRDVEFLLCVAIRTVRAGEAVAAAALLGSLVFPKPPGESSRWRVQAYDQCPEPQRDAAFGLVGPLAGSLFVYLFLQRPSVYIVASVAAPLVAAGLVAYFAVRGMVGPSNQLANAVASVPSDTGPLAHA
jgi:hypothetical protein